MKLSDQKYSDRTNLTDVPRLCGMPDPIGVLLEEHALQRELCDILESIADGLPYKFNLHLAGVATAILASSLPDHTRFEDEALFPLLRQRAGGGEAIHPVLNRLEDEHHGDEGMLDKVIHMLKSAIAGGLKGLNDQGELLGFVLRGFIESQRRHIAWEDQVVVPLARSVLTNDDLAALQSWIMMSGRPRCTRQTLTLFLRPPKPEDACKTCDCKMQEKLEPANDRQKIAVGI